MNDGYFLLSLVLVICTVMLGFKLLKRTLERDPSKRWGWIELTLAWFGWLAISMLAVAVFLPNISCAKEAARRAQCYNNLKMIALAMHNYHDEYGCFPPAYTVDKTGRPLHSWRVLLLPCVCRRWRGLCQSLRLDEPYDSPHNQAIFQSEEMPSLFRCPSDGDDRMDTNYVMLVGPHTLSNGPNSIRRKDITDGESKTIAVVETYDLAIRWYEPRDLRVDEMSFRINDPRHFGIASRHAGGAQVAFVDGHTEFLTDATDPRVVQAMMTINGGEDVSGLLDTR